MLSSHSNIQPGSQFIACCYVNSTSTMQIGRISNIANWYFEKVILPGQRLIFEAPSQAVLEINTSLNITAILSEKIQCQSLRMDTPTTILSYKTVQI